VQILSETIFEKAEEMNPIKFIYRLLVKEKCTCYRIPATFIQGGFECPACTRKRRNAYKNQRPPDPMLYLEGIKAGEIVSIEEGRYAGNDAEVRALDHDTKELIVRVIKGRQDDYRIPDDFWISYRPLEYHTEGTIRIPALSAQLMLVVCDGRTLSRSHHVKMFETIQAMSPSVEADTKPFDLPDLTGKYWRAKE
jgi:hypothetical protein